MMLQWLQNMRDIVKELELIDPCLVCLRSSIDLASDAGFRPSLIAGAAARHKLNSYRHELLRRSLQAIVCAL